MKFCHKSDVGGVHLGVSDTTQLIAAITAIDAIATAPAEPVSRRARDGPRPGTSHWAVRDDSFGAIVTLGLGGVDVELIDRSISRLVLSLGDRRFRDGQRLPPGLLTGHSGSAPIDRGELIALLETVSSIMQGAPQITEIDLNPVRLGVAGWSYSMRSSCVAERE